MKSLSKISRITITSLLLMSCGQTPPPLSAPIQDQAAQLEEGLVDGLAIQTPGGQEPLAIADSCMDFSDYNDVIREPFHLTSTNEGVGLVTLEGTIKMHRETIYDESIERVYMLVKEPAIGGTYSIFYDYLKARNVGGGIDLDSQDTASLVLGIMKDGNFSTTAGVSPEAHERILSSKNTGQSVHLTIRIPRYLGRGAPSNFSVACMIE